jgi:glucokinase
MKKIIGLDLGGTFIKIGVVNEKGKILSKKEIPTPKRQGRRKILEVMAENIDSFLHNYPRKEFLGIGIGTPGLVDEGGKVFLAPNLPDWHNLNLKKIFEDTSSEQGEVMTISSVLRSGQVWGVGLY